jgi:hypothetical protein
MPLSFAHQFNKPERSDVRLTLCTCNNSPCVGTGSRRVDYNLVGFLLVSRSEYFATRLSELWRSDGQQTLQCSSKLVRVTVEAATTKPPFKSSGAVLDIMEHVQETEVDAADMLLRSCYTGEVNTMSACMQAYVATLHVGHGHVYPGHCPPGAVLGSSEG